MCVCVCVCLNICIYKYINTHSYIYIYHHHHVVPLARISLTLSRHFSLSFIASCRSSVLIINRIVYINNFRCIKCCEQYWTSPGGNTPQGTNYTATCLPSRKLSRHAGHCWRSRDELISDVLLWTPTYGRAKAGWPARTYIQQLCEDTGCSPENLPEVMNDSEKWRERVRDIHASGTTWWWWYIYIYIYIINNVSSAILLFPLCQFF